MKLKEAPDKAPPLSAGGVATNMQGSLVSEVLALKLKKRAAKTKSEEQESVGGESSRWGE